MEASALQAPAGLTRNRISIGASLLRLRSDEQLVSLFRAGHDEAFRVIHDRYRQRLLAYMRQMLPDPRFDAEDVLQDVFVRAYQGLRSHDRELSLRPWLYRIARNRSIDELRRPQPMAQTDVVERFQARGHDPVIETERRETMRRLVVDVGRLPEQQRSALLMRELAGMPYADVAAVLGTSVSAVKSLLVRARLGLGQSIEARDTACSDIREELATAHARGVRPSGIARRHMRECVCCQEYRVQMRSVSRELAALSPTIGPLGLLAKLGFGGGGSATASGGAAAGGGAAAAAAGAASSGGAFVSAGILGVSATHVATLVAAVVITAGGAVGIRDTIAGQSGNAQVHRAAIQPRYAGPPSALPPVLGPSNPSGSSPSPSAHTYPTSHLAPAPSTPGRVAPAPAATTGTSAVSTTTSSSTVPSTTSLGSTSAHTSCPTGTVPSHATGHPCVYSGTTSPLGTLGTTPLGVPRGTTPPTETTTGVGSGTGTGTGSSSGSPTGGSTQSPTGSGAGTATGNSTQTATGTPTPKGAASGP